MHARASGSHYTGKVFYSFNTCWILSIFSRTRASGCHSVARSAESKASWLARAWFNEDGQARSFRTTGGGGGGGGEERTTSALAGNVARLVVQSLVGFFTNAGCGVPKGAVTTQGPGLAWHRRVLLLLEGEGLGRGNEQMSRDR